MKKLILAIIIAASVGSPAVWAEDDAACLKIVSETLGSATAFSCSSTQGENAKLEVGRGLSSRYRRDDRLRALVSFDRNSGEANIRTFRSYDADVDQALIDDLLAAYQDAESTPETGSDTEESNSTGTSTSSASSTVVSTASGSETPTVDVMTEQSGNSSVDANGSATNSEGVTVSEGSSSVEV